MAYTFQKINDQFGDRPQKFDIFGQQDTPQGGGQAQGQEGFKTSAEGDLAGAGGGAGQEANRPQAPQGPRGANAAVIKANVGKVRPPKAFGNIEAALGQKEQELQKEADSYVDQAKSADYGMSQGAISGAAKGDKGDFNLIASRLSQGSPYREAFKPKSVDIEGANQLSSDEGVLNLIAKEAGPQFTSGERALSRSVLTRDPNFTRIRESLDKRTKDLKKKAADYSVDKTKEARELDAKRYGIGTENILGQLKQARAGLDSELADKVAAENLARQGLRSHGDKDYIGQRSKAAYDELLGKYANDPLGGYLKGLNVDPSQFYGVGQDLTADDLRTQEDAARFNTINQLLGLGGIKATPAVAGRGAGERQSFNSQAYQDALIKQAQAIQAAKQAQQEAALGKLSSAPVVDFPSQPYGSSIIPGYNYEIPGVGNYDPIGAPVSVAAIPQVQSPTLSPGQLALPNEISQYNSGSESSPAFSPIRRDPAGNPIIAGPAEQKALEGAATHPVIEERFPNLKDLLGYY